MYMYKYKYYHNKRMKRWFWNTYAPLGHVHCRVLDIHNRFHFSMCNLCQENYWKLPIILIRSPKAKKCSIVPKTKLDLHILMIYLYTKFHFSMCNQCEENERKLSGPTDLPTDRRTAAKQYALPSSKWRGHNHNECIFIIILVSSFKC
jgi:hypothetical protein